MTPSAPRRHLHLCRVTQQVLTVPLARYPKPFALSHPGRDPPRWRRSKRIVPNLQPTQRLVLLGLEVFLKSSWTVGIRRDSLLSFAHHLPEAHVDGGYRP